MSKNNQKLSTTFSAGEKTAATIAQVALDTGKPYRISTSRYNRYAKQFGIPTYNHLDLQNFVDDYILEEKEHSGGIHWDAFRDVYTGKLKYSDVVGTNETKQEMSTKISRGNNTQVILHQHFLDANRIYRRDQRWHARIITGTQGVLDDLAKHVRHYAKELDGKNYAKPPKLSTKPNNKTLVLTAADWHCGDAMEADMPNYRNKYNWNIAQKRWWHYVHSALHTAKINHVGNLVLAGMGDLITGAYMRPSNQSCIEFDYSQQVNHVIDMLVRTLRFLSKYYPVTFINVVGNHDRVGSFKANIYSDSATQIETHFIKMIHIPNVKVIEAKDPHDYVLNIQGSKVLFTHGEKVKPNKSNNIQNLEANENINMLVYAHWHYYHVESNDCGKLEVGLPALKGFDRYNKKITTTVASSGQLSILMEKNKTPKFIPVLFDDEK